MQIDRLQQLQDAARERGIIVKVHVLGVAGAAAATSAATTAAAADIKASPVFDASSAAPTDYGTQESSVQGQRVGTGTEVAAFLGVSWKASEAKAEADKRQSMDEFYAQAGEVQRGLGLINKNLDLLDQKRIDVINATSQQQEQAIRDSVDEIVSDVNRSMVGTKKKIEAMGESTKTFETKYASKCHIASELRIRNGMEQAGLRRLNEYLKRFQKLQSDFNSDIREKLFGNWPSRSLLQQRPRGRLWLMKECNHRNSTSGPRKIGSPSCRASGTDMSRFKDWNSRFKK